MSALWPMITPGTPEKAAKPATSSGHSLVISLQCNPICIHLQAHAEVRVVGQQWRPGLGVLTVDDPAVAAHPVAATDERRQPIQGAVQPGQLLPLVGGERRSLGVAGAALLRVRLEDAVDDCALADDRGVGPVVEGREQLG